MFTKNVSNRIPMRRFRCSRQFSTGCPLIKISVWYLLIGIIVPYIIRVLAITIRYLGLPVFLTLVGNVNLCTLIERIANNRFSRYRYDIGEFLRIKAGDRCSVHLNIRNYGRIGCRHSRNNTVNLIGHGVVVGLDGNDRRIVYSTRLNEYGLGIVRLLIRYVQRTRTERHINLEIAFGFILQVQDLFQIFIIVNTNRNCCKQVLRLEHLALEENIVCAGVAVLGYHDDLAGLTDRTRDNIDALLGLGFLINHLRALRRAERQNNFIIRLVSLEGDLSVL